MFDFVIILLALFIPLTNIHLLMYFHLTHLIQVVILGQLWYTIKDLKDHLCKLIKSFHAASTQHFEGEDQAQSLGVVFLDSARVSRKVIDESIGPKTKEGFRLVATMYNKVTG